MPKHNRISDASLLEISIVDKGASGDSEDRPRIVIAKRDMEKAMPDLTPIMAKLSPEEQAMVALALEEAAKGPAPEMAPEPPPAPAVPEKQEEPAAPPPAEDEEEPMEVAKALEQCSEADRQAVLEAIEKRDTLEKRVAELEEREEVAKFTEIAKSMDALPGMTTDQRATLLRSVSKSASAEDYEAIEKSLRDASETIAKSLAEVGSSASAPTDAQSRLEQIAKALREQDPSLKPSQAKIKALEENPDLYQELAGR